MQHEKVQYEENMKSERNSEKSAIWKIYNMERVQHEKSATQIECKTKKVQQKKS